MPRKDKRAETQQKGKLSLFTEVEPFRETKLAVGDLEVLRSTRDSKLFSVLSREQVQDIFKLCQLPETNVRSNVDQFLNHQLEFMGEILPLGVCVVLAPSGCGKTKVFQEECVSLVQQGAQVVVTTMGEPLSFVEYSLSTLLGLLELTSLQKSGPRVLMVDSLMRMWSDPIVNEGRGYGARGASWGVPIALGNLQLMCERAGVTLVCTLNPSLASVEDVSNSLSGMVAGFYSLSEGTGIVRDHSQVYENQSLFFGLPYVRKEFELPEGKGRVLNPTRRNNRQWKDKISFLSYEEDD